jgi:hypothetical protein
VSAATSPPPGQPGPPANLSTRKPLLRTLPIGSAVHRFYSKVHDPVYFDRSSGVASGRFNSPDGSYGVIYTSEGREGAFAETFLRDPGATLVSMKLILTKGYVRFETTRELVLLQLYGAGLARVGATAEVSHRSPPYDTTQTWSKALRDAFPISGIAYTSRHDDQAVCYALFKSGAGALREVERETMLMQPWFADLINQYRLGIEV